MNRTQDIFDLARNELLDLSLRNTLINFKPRAAYGVFFSHANLGEFFDQFVNQQKQFTFGSGTQRNTANSTKINIDITEGLLKTKLTKTYRQSKSFLEEKGVNTLFLAVGFIKAINDSVELNAPLILIPAEIKKKENTDTYYITYSTEEIRENISIITKLKNDFGLDLTYGEEDIVNLDQYFRTIIKQLDGNTKVTLNLEEAALDFFSFTKLLMFQDLAIESWTDADGKLSNKMVDNLFVNDFSAKSKTKIPDDISAATICNVLDSDSSQSETIYEIMKGRNLVLQGPPGTGKSQTITNIIANSIANNKSVLFVSEKMAALDVVKRRLESVGLGDLVLELHSQKTNKKRVLKSIQTTLELGEPKSVTNAQLYEKYIENSDELNSYIEKLGVNIKKTDFTLSEIYAKALEIESRLNENNVKLPKIEIKNLENLNKTEYLTRVNILSEFVNVINTIGLIEKHPLYGFELDSCMPFEQVAIKDKLIVIEEAINQLIKVSNEINTFFGTKNLSSISDVKKFVKSLSFLLKFKNEFNLNQKDNNFETEKGIQKIRQYITLSKKLQENYLENTYFKKEVFLNRRYRDFVTQYVEKPTDELLQSIETGFLKPGGAKTKISYLEKHFALFNKYLEQEKEIENIFGDFYNGVYNTNWNVLDKNIDEIHNMYKLIETGEIISQVKLVDYLNKDRIEELQTNLNEAVEIFTESLEKFLEQTDYNSYKKFNYTTWYNDLMFTEVKKHILQMKNNIGDIDKIAIYNKSITKLRQLGLKDIVKLIGNFRYNYTYLIDLFSYTYFDFLINHAYDLYPELNEFKKYKANRLVDAFKELDMKIMVENIKLILVKHWETMPKIDDQSKQMSIIRRELQKMKNHMPVRKLISKTADSLIKIKPVFMMSPLSIAQYLAPQDVVFDLVVFDEASQVRPVEAFGALLRAKQIVVVGDSKQLPPTSFFDKVATKFEEVDDDDYDFGSMESILSLLLAKNVPFRTLEWHYRSKHQSLINFSNKRFYSSKLKTFPSVHESDPEIGLIFNYNPKTAYERGITSTNPLEAKQVIEYAFKHAKEHPDLTMGVASFSIVQQECLMRVFDKMLKNTTDPEIKAYFSDNKLEPFFIKNLENVQGDERDVILVSIGYGFDKNRKITMDFGPINKNEGERRLNVLVTRAKEKCVVFANIKASDINLSRTNSSGVEALKGFLNYAEERSLSTASSNEREDILFIDLLNQKLNSYGYKTDLNIGANVGIDIAIFDEEMNQFICGIETDFGNYKTIKSTTDRERIRHGVLKTLGWKLYHIWSNDYYRNPKVELENIFNFIERAKTQTKDDEEQTKIQLEFKRKAVQAKKLEEFTMPYKKYSGQKRRANVLTDSEALSKLVNSIVEAESPIHIAVIKKRLSEITEKDVFNENAQFTFDFVVKRVPVLHDGDFLIDETKKLWIRNRKDEDLNLRKVDYIHNSELHAGILYVIERGIAATKEEIAKEVSLLLGFVRNAKIMQRVVEIIDKLEKENSIYLEDNIYFLTDDVLSYLDLLESENNGEETNNSED